MNLFHQRISSDKNDIELKKKKMKSHKKNDLKNYVLEKRIHLKTKNTRIKTCTFIETISIDS